MSLFSGETVITVAAVNTRLFHDDFPNTVRDAVLRAVSLEQDVSNNILQALLSGFNINLTKYLRYGHNIYWRGLPESRGVGTVVDLNSIKIAVEKYLTKEPVTIINGSIGYEDNNYYVYYYLQSFPEWDAVEGTFLNQGLTYYYETWEYTYLINEINPNKIKISTHYRVENGDIGDYDEFKAYFYIDVLPTYYGYYKATYLIDSQENPEAIYYLLYDGTANVIPELPPPVENVIESEYYPIVAIMDNKTKVGTFAEWQYDQSVAILDKVGISLDDMWDSVNESPDIEDIDDVAFLFGAPIKSTHDNTIEYLMRYFSDLSNRVNFDKAYFDSRISIMSQLNNTGTVFDGVQANLIEINEDQYKFKLSFYYIEVTAHTGVRPKKFESIPNIATNTQYNSGNIEDGTWTIHSVNNNNMTWYWQYTDTQYFKVFVRGVQSANTIMTDPSYGKTSFKTLSADDFIIPLNHTILKTLSLKEQIIVAYDSMYLTINAIHEEELAWYESGGFITLVTVVVMFVGFYFGAMQIGAVLSNLATQTMRQILTNIAKMIITKVVLDWLAEEIGGIAGAFVAAAASAAMGAYAAGGTGPKGLPFADALVNAVTAFTTDFAARLKKLTAGDMAELTKDYNDFLEEAEAMEAELEELEELAYTGSGVHDLAYVEESYTLINSNESSGDYFRRTVHTPNPGVLGYESLHNYVRNALRLPQPNAEDNLLL